MVRSILLAILGTTILHSYASASCLDQAATFAERICGEISKNGSQSKLSSELSLEARVNSLLARIIGSGSADGSVSYDRDTYEGVVREQLETDRFKARDCRTKMVDVAIKQECRPYSGDKGSKYVKVDTVYTIKTTGNHHCSSNCRNEPTKTGYDAVIIVPPSPDSRKQRLANPSISCKDGACPFSTVTGQPRITDNGQTARAEFSVWGHPTTWQLSADLEELR